jgi:type II secretory pathway pseudopilin PulG
MEPRTTPGERPARRGYALIILMFAVFVLGLGLLIATPVWQTETQRDKEEELIFRGRQYVEAVRIYVQKNPGRFPASLKELLDKKCIRRLYRDPLGPGGEWNVVLSPGRGPTGVREAVQEVLVAPERALPAIKNAQVLGVVSSSMNKSIKIYNDQDSHDKWLFFYGFDPKKPPKIIRYGEKE